MNNSFLISDSEVLNSDYYKNFIRVNSGKGNLKIHAYAASEALPVSGLKVVVSSLIENKKVVFYEGYTDASGMIETLSLPAPKLSFDNLSVPLTVSYDIDASYKGESIPTTFHINMYDGVCVVQNINYVPGGVYGS